MAITSLDQVVAGMQPSLPFYKVNGAGLTANQLYSLWRVQGRPAGGGIPPASPGEIPTSLSSGAFAFTNPAGGKLSYLAKLAAAGTLAGMLFLYDRLSHVQFNGTITGDQTLMDATTAVNRPVNGSGEMFFEYTSTVTVPRAITVTYVNQAGTAGRTATVTIPAGATDMLFPILPLSTASSVNDTGARYASKVNIAVGSTGANPLSLVIMRRIAAIPLLAPTQGSTLNAIETGFQQINDSACLALVQFLSTTSNGTMIGDLAMAQG